MSNDLPAKINNGFWSKLPKPFFALAPMADVTDAAFRRLIAKHGKPDVMWTEFVAVDGLLSPGRDILLKDFIYTEAERPIVAQIFGSKPDNFYKVAQIIADLGFDGIDINMGCPDRNVEKQGGGAAMIKTPELPLDIIRATQEGGNKNGKRLPVSVKTRVGYNKVELDTWLPALLSVKPAAITVHARTRKEMSDVPAQWGLVKTAVEMAKGSGTLIIGNGDVKDLADAKQKAAETGADGVMLGRAIFGNPWLFANLARVKHDCQIEHPVSIAPDTERKTQYNDAGNLLYASQSRNSAERSECDAPTHSRAIDMGQSVQVADIPLEERFRVMLEHTKLFMELLGDVKNFAVMKKHYKAYVNNFDGAKELRVKLMESNSVEEISRIVADWLAQNPRLLR